MQTYRVDVRTSYGVTLAQHTRAGSAQEAETNVLAGLARYSPQLTGLSIEKTRLASERYQRV